MKPEDRDALVQELAPLLLALVLAHNWPWVEHQAWRLRTRLRTMRGRRAVERGKVQRQVQREISWMEHGVEDPLAR
jgi:hypothetical protein